MMNLFVDMIDPKEGSIEERKFEEVHQLKRIEKDKGICMYRIYRMR
jgi:hypothetical protein